MNTVRSVGAALAMFSSSAVLVSGCGSKGRSNGAEEAVAKVTELKDRMCACKDKDCATKVNDDYTRWGTELASRMANNKDLQNERPDEAMAKRMTEVAMAYGECMMRAMRDGGYDDVPIDAAPPIDAPPPDWTAPVAPTKPADADKMIRAAIDWTRERRDGAAIGRIELQYVGMDGTLDDDDGTLVIGFGVPTNDSKRKIGAPVKQPPKQSVQCFTLTLTKTGWINGEVDCAPTFPAKPACSVAGVLKKAIAAGAPAEALAMVSVSTPNPTQLRWDVKIDDDPRNIHFNHSFVDDCVVKLEETPN